MQIIHDLSFDAPDLPPAVITIGNYDGIHCGHQQVLQRVKSRSQETGAVSAVLSFTNHPLQVLKQGFKISRLCTLADKIRLIERQGIDLLALLTFTESFAQQTPKEFLFHLMAAIPFTHLILGHDATIGKDKTGDRNALLPVAEEMGFILEYLPPYSLEGVVVSSSKIREYLLCGNFTEASKLLGRKYSIFSTVEYGQGHGKKIGFPTINVAVEGLCTPPLGVYAVTAKLQGQLFDGIANLGIAPTIRTESHPILEVHLFDYDAETYGDQIEVFFEQYIRPEERFNNIEELKTQIARDILSAKGIHSLKI